MAASKPAKKTARGKMSANITNNWRDRRRRADELRTERRLRRNLEKGDPHTTEDHEALPQMTRYSKATKALGKRKRERDEDVEQPGKKPAAQDKECTVCLELTTRTSFPIIQHAVGGEHGSDVCLSCWDQHIESEVRSKSSEGISCLQCPQRLVEEEVRHLATNSTYDE